MLIACIYEFLDLTQLQLEYLNVLCYLRATSLKLLSITRIYITYQII